MPVRGKTRFKWEKGGTVLSWPISGKTPIGTPKALKNWCNTDVSIHKRKHKRLLLGQYGLYAWLNNRNAKIPHIFENQCTFCGLTPYRPIWSHPSHFHLHTVWPEFCFTSHSAHFVWSFQSCPTPGSCSWPPAYQRRTRPRLTSSGRWRKLYPIRRNVIPT